MNKEHQGAAPYAGPPKALTERNAAMAVELTAPAQAISAEERFDEWFRLTSFRTEMSCGTEEWVRIARPLFSDSLAAHAAQEVSRVESAYKAELAERHVGYKATCKALEEAQSELAQLRETLAQKEGELAIEKQERQGMCSHWETEYYKMKKELRQSLAQVEGERDAARKDASEGHKLAEQRLAERNATQEEISTLAAERDALKAQVERASTSKP